MRPLNLTVRSACMRIVDGTQIQPDYIGRLAARSPNESVRSFVNQTVFPRLRMDDKTM